MAMKRCVWLMALPVMLALVCCGQKGEQLSLTEAQKDEENLTPEQARKRLQDMGIEYSEYSFLFRIREGRTTAVKLFLKAGMNPNIVDTHHILSGSSGSTSAFMDVVSTGRPDMAIAFVEAGADVNARDTSRFTALMHAALRGEPKLVDALINAGADVNAAVGSGSTALILAVGGGGNPDSALVDMMLKSVGNLKESLDENARPRQGGGTSAIPESAPAQELVKALIRAGADVNVQTAHGDTPLMYSVHSGRAEMVKILLENGADADLKNMSGETALMVAQRKGRADIVELLK